MSAGKKAGFMRTVATGVIAASCGLACLGAAGTSAIAAKGGNSANAELCHGGYPGVLLGQDGSAFKNAGKCTSYGAKGGQFAGVNAVVGPIEFNVFEETYSGFGLKPGTEVMGCATYSPSGEVLCIEPAPPVVAADGTFSEFEGLPCKKINGSKVSGLFVEATTASGVLFKREFPPPAGC